MFDPKSIKIDQTSIKNEVRRLFWDRSRSKVDSERVPTTTRRWLWLPFWDQNPSKIDKKCNQFLDLFLEDVGASFRVVFWSIEVEKCGFMKMSVSCRRSALGGQNRSKKGFENRRIVWRHFWWILTPLWISFCGKRLQKSMPQNERQTCDFVGVRRKRGLK